MLCEKGIKGGDKTLYHIYYHIWQMIIWVHKYVGSQYDFHELRSSDVKS